MDIVEASAPPATALYPSAARSSSNMPPASAARPYRKASRKNGTVIDVDSAIFQVLSLYISQADATLDTTLLPLSVASSSHKQQQRYKRAQSDQHTSDIKYLQRPGTAAKKNQHQAPFLKSRLASKSWLGDTYYHNEPSRMKSLSDLELDMNTFKNSVTIKADDVSASKSNITPTASTSRKKKTVSFNDTVTVMSLSQQKTHSSISDSSEYDGEDDNSFNNNDNFFDALEFFSHE